MDCSAMDAIDAKVESLRATVMTHVEGMMQRLAASLLQTEATLEEMECSVVQAMHGLGTATLTALCAAQTPRYPAPSLPCPCGGQAAYVRRRTAQCKTLLGMIQVKRAYYLCAACHAGCSPLDQKLGFCAGSISAGLEALLALLGTEFSYGHAAALVERLSLVSVSAGRCRQATLAMGEALAAQEEAVRHTVWEQGHEPPPVVPLPHCAQAHSAQLLDPLYVSADGVMVLTRETGWREQCVGAVYTARDLACAAPAAGAARPLRGQAHSYVSDLGDRPAFAQSLWLEAHRRGLEQAKRVVFIGDGAAWLWQMAEEHFPTAIQILDWYHVTGYVRQAAQALYPQDAPLRTQWAEAQLAALWQSRSAEVIARFATLAAACPAAREAHAYFTTNQSRMDYARFRSLGLQVGSGTIESACKHVIQARLKQAGMRWRVSSARSMGKLRARLKSGRWEETLALRPTLARTYHRHAAI